METIGAYEVKTHLSGLLKRVERGESFTVTKNGVPVAKLVPIQEKPRADLRQVIEEIRRFRKERPLGSLSVAELKELIADQKQVESTRRNRSNQLGRRRIELDIGHNSDVPFRHFSQHATRRFAQSKHSQT